MYNQLFLAKNNYPMCKTGHIKKNKNKKYKIFQKLNKNFFYMQTKSN